MHRIQSFVKDNKFFCYFLLGYLLIRVFLIDVNYTEWGDTFRMIRGADYLARGDWPWDEKRWPFYSLLLVPGVWIGVPVLWGRIISLLVSSGTVFLIYIFYLNYISKNKNYALLSAVLTVMSSVFAYWSFRAMADPVFTFLIIFFVYSFMGFNWRWKSQYTSWKTVSLSAILLAITMTRLEGVFIAASTGLFLLFKHRWKDMLIFFVPQGFIYLPWTIYAKFIYSGPVQNDYFEEVQRFVFNFARFEYFFTYTLFILITPVLSHFLISDIRKWLGNGLKERLWFPLFGFIFLEILIGFIWTPSLPRIYMPIIPFLMIFSVYGLERFEVKKSKVHYILFNSILLILFVYLQFKQKLYFLGASKTLFVLLLIYGIFMLFLVFSSSYFKKILAVSLIFINILVSIIVINNQRFIYKTVKQAIDFVLPMEGIVAYSDETGNTEWYLKDTSYYLKQDKNLGDFDQYGVLKESSAQYLLWTNEFNRGSSFTDPVDDPRYMLLAKFEQPIRDPFDILLDSWGIFEDKNYQVFATKVYRVK